MELISSLEKGKRGIYAGKDYFHVIHVKYKKVIQKKEEYQKSEEEKEKQRGVEISWKKVFTRNFFLWELWNEKNIF